MMRPARSISRELTAGAGPQAALQSIVVVVAAGILASGCSTEPQEVGSANVKSALIIAADGGQIVVTSEDHVGLAGTRIVIPPGALAQDTRITIRPGPESIADADGISAGPAVRFGPDGTTFSTAAQVTLPYTAAWDPDLARVFVQRTSGAAVVLPFDLLWNESDRTTTLDVTAFSVFQGGRATSACSHLVCDTNVCRQGRCGGNPTCAAADCGPAPRLPSWQCDDGTTGGPTGRCLPEPNGGCAWEINWCPQACDAAACGPVPMLPPFLCADGRGPPVVCRREPGGDCAWSVTTCRPQCAERECGPRPMRASMLCSDGTIAGPVCGQHNGDRCQWRTLFCCDDPNGNCADPCLDVRCERGLRCDPTSGECTGGESCGENTCAPDTRCCNRGCGRCVPASQTCPDISCETCGSRHCPPMWTCDQANQRCLPPACPPDGCANQPEPAGWTCEDGSAGGGTGRCILSPDAGASRCTWEINNCPRRCDANDCSPPTDPSATCPDGSAVSYECRRGPNGQCTATPRDC